MTTIILKQVTDNFSHSMIHGICSKVFNWVTNVFPQEDFVYNNNQDDVSWEITEEKGYEAITLQCTSHDFKAVVVFEHSLVFTYEKEKYLDVAKHLDEFIELEKYIIEKLSVFEQQFVDNDKYPNYVPLGT